MNFAIIANLVLTKWLYVHQITNAVSLVVGRVVRVSKVTTTTAGGRSEFCRFVLTPHPGVTHSSSRSLTSLIMTRKSPSNKEAHTRLMYREHDRRGAASQSLRNSFSFVNRLFYPDY